VTRLIPILLELEDALAEVDAARERPSGLLRLTASETVSMLLVQTVIPAFLKQYPDMVVDLVAQAAFVDIVAEGFDAGFRLGEALPLDMVAVRFGGPSRMLAVASPAYLEGREPPRTPDDLAQHLCIRSRTPDGRPYRWEFEHAGHAIAIEVPGILTLNRTELMMEPWAALGSHSCPSVWRFRTLRRARLSLCWTTGVQTMRACSCTIPATVTCRLDCVRSSTRSKRRPWRDRRINALQHPSKSIKRTG
jgi:DNA-binding transcriptional LysR family regulator